MMRKNTAWIFWMALAVFAAVTIGAVLSVVAPRFGFVSSRMFLSLALVAVALITFFGFLWHGLRPDRMLDEGDLRTAITVSIVTVYLVLVSLVAFFQARGEGDELPRLTETMLTSFTAIVAIIVPFYFGTSAYVQVKRQELASKDSATD